MIRSIAFVDASLFTAHFVVKFRDAYMQDGQLSLRAVSDNGVDIDDLPALKAWKSARTLLSKIRNGAAPFFDGRVPELGRVWVETLPPDTCSPWEREEGEYAESHIRTRLCIVPAVDAYTCCGPERLVIPPSLIHVVDHRKFCSEMNLGQNARTHLIVDLKVPDGQAED